MDSSDNADDWTRVSLIPGPSALTLFRAGMANLAVLGLLTFTFAGVQIGTNVGFSEPMPTVMFFVIAVQAAVLIPVFVHAVRRTVDREVAAGYTTTFGAFPEVQQADPQTGLVIRESGKPPLSPEERTFQRQRIAAYKSRSAVDS